MTTLPTTKLPSPTGLTAVGIHIFSGLFTRGLTDIGFDVKCTLEDGKFGVATHRLNFPGVPVHDDPQHWPVEDLKGIDLVYSNSACAGFSTASQSKGLESASNNQLKLAHDTAVKLLPRAYVVESVVNLFKDGDPLVRQWETQWAELGYKTTRIVEDALHLGLAQRRRRALFVATRENFCPAYPDAHSSVTTVGDAIYDLRAAVANIAEKPYSQFVKYPECAVLSNYAANLRGGGAGTTWHASPKPSHAMMSLIPYSKPGQRLQEMSDDIMRETYWKHKQGKKPTGRPGLLNRRLDHGLPGYTLTGGCHWIHPEFDRYITVREKARLMGVPDDFTFNSTSLHDAYAEVGKAVSPVVGRWIGTQLAESLNGLHKTHTSAVDFTRPAKPATIHKEDLQPQEGDDTE